MSGVFLPTYALPVCILLSVPYIFLNNLFFHFTRFLPVLNRDYYNPRKSIFKDRRNCKQVKQAFKHDLRNRAFVRCNGFKLLYETQGKLPEHI